MRSKLYALTEKPSNQSIKGHIMKQFRSEYLDKLDNRTHKFPELDNLTLVDVEVHGFRGREEEKSESVSWEEVEKMLEGGSIWK